jgi:hypothetical protein
MNWLIVALEIIGLAFTMSLYQVTILSYISSIKTDYTYCVKNNVYGEFWIELLMFFYGSIAIFTLIVYDIIKRVT